MLDKLKGIILSPKEKPDGFIFSGISAKKPNHIAITTDGSLSYKQAKNLSPDDFYARFSMIVRQLFDYQQKCHIPVMTLYLLGSFTEQDSLYDEYISHLSRLLAGLVHNETVSGGHVKVSVIGKWYDLPVSLVDSVRKLTDTTKDGEGAHFNFCLNYDGQEEVVDACKLLVRQVMASKIDISQISKDVIKENTYSSYFPAPDIIIKNGSKRCTKGIFLFDSSLSTLFFTGKMFPDISSGDIDKAIELWQKG